MWICSCHAVTDGMIKEFAKAHGCAWKKMTKELKVGTQCGTCAKSAKKILEQAAGKPKKKRSKKRKTGGETLLPGTNADSPVDSPVDSSVTPTVSSPADLQSANVGIDTSTPSPDQSTTPPQTPSPAFLPCGKCTCTCGK